MKPSHIVIALAVVLTASLWIIATKPIFGDFAEKIKTPSVESMP